MFNLLLKKAETIERLLKEELMFNKPFLTIEECSSYTGLKTSTLYQLTSRNEIPYFKPGGKKVYVKREDIDAWILQNRISTAEELDSDAINYLLTKSEIEHGTENS